MVVDPWQRKLNPESIVDAQFSMAFGAAVAILYGKASLDEYNMDNINSPVVKEMMQRIECVEDSEIEIDYPQKWPAKADIFTKDGRKFSTRVEYPKGDPENPLTWEEIIEKFKRLTEPVYNGERMDEIVACVRNFEQEPDLHRLLALTEK